MSRATWIVLVLLVGTLSWAAWRATREEDRARAESDVRLFEDLDENEVVALRVENLRRDLVVRFERDPRGGWVITDPIHARAESQPPDLILQAAMMRRGTPVPESERDLSNLGLDPPQHVLEVETERDGRRTRQRVEFGAADVDGQRVHVLVRGRVLRTLRDLDVLLDLPLHEYRSSAATRVDPREVVEVHRRGAVAPEGGGPARDAAFDAARTDGVWRATAPLTGLLDPAVMAIYAQSTAGLRFDTVVDEGQRTLATLGLDPPELTVELGTPRAETITLVFGRSGPQREGAWCGSALGEPLVWAADVDLVRMLATPVEDLLDHKLERLPNAQVDLVELSAPGGEVRLRKDAFGWKVAWAHAGSRVFGPPVAAEPSAVEDLLGELARFDLTEFRRALAWDEGAAPHRFAVHAGEDAVAGTFGAAYTGSGGGTAVLFRRDGETAVALADPAILARLAQPARRFWSLTVRDTTEAGLVSLSIAKGGRERRFARSPQGVWIPEGGELEARELRGVLDPLFFLKAREHHGEEGQPPLEDPVVVVLREDTGNVVRFTFGWARRGGARGAEVEYEGRRSALADPKLIPALEAVLDAGG